jgi:SAM-dependent methyltransferase
MQPYVDAYRQGRWRATIMADVIHEEMRNFAEPPTVLDIGCGMGFDNSPELQAQIAAAAGRYIGVEPDRAVSIPSCVDEVHRCTLEDAPIQAGSVDLAFAIMVLEHVTSPQEFFQKLHTVLAPKGVFWGLTVDRRHWFRLASTLLETMRVKDWYLKHVIGKQEDGLYINYPTAYRANSPHQISRYARNFASRDFVTWHKVGQLDYYLPRALRLPAALLDRVIARLGTPGAILVCRLGR